MELTTEQQQQLDDMTTLQRNCALERLADPKASSREIYQRAGGKAKNEATIDTCAHEILRNPKIEHFLRISQRPSQNEKVMTREQLLEDLTMISNASIDDVMTFGQTGHEYIDTETGETLPGQSIIHVKNMSEMSPAARKLIKSVKQSRYGIEVTLHDPMVARKMLADMQGFNAPVVNVNLNQERTVTDEEFAAELERLGV